MTKPTNFQLVSRMNTAFGNPQGDPNNIDWERVRNQSRNILDEFLELFVALGVPHGHIAQIGAFFDEWRDIDNPVDLDGVRDAAVDIHVYTYGIHHLLGLDADRDMVSVIDGVMTRFIKNAEDKEATIAKHAKKGVVDVTFEGEYPTMIMRSNSDQPDAPKGKFMKSASFSEPVFYPVSIGIPRAAETNQEARELLDRQNKMLADEAAASAARETPDA